MDEKETRKIMSKIQNMKIILAVMVVLFVISISGHIVQRNQTTHWKKIACDRTKDILLRQYGVRR